MAVSFVSAGTFAASGSIPTLSLIAPACVAGDILIAAIVQKANQVVSPPDGTWTLISEGNNTAALRHTIFWKRATASGGTFDFTKPVDDNLVFAGLIAVYRGCELVGNPIDATSPSVSTNASSDTVTYADFDPTQTVLPFVVALGFYADDLTTAGAMSGTDPTFALNFDVETSSGTDCSLFGYSGASSGAATGSRTHSTTSTVDAVNTGVMFGLVARTRVENTFETGAVDEADITTTTPASPHAFNVVTLSSGTLKTDDDAGMAEGTFAARSSITTAGFAYGEWGASWQTETEVWMRMYFSVSDATPATSFDIMRLLSGTSNAMNVQLRTNSVIGLRDSGSTLRYSSTYTVTANTVVRIEVHVVHSTTVGHMEARLFYGANLHGTTPDETFGNLTDNWNLLASSTGARLGVVSTPGQTIDAWWDAAALDNRAWVGPAITAASGTVAVTQDAQTSTASGLETVTGTSAQTQQDQTPAATGTVANPVSGTVAVTQDPQTSSGAALETIIGSTASSQPGAFSSAFSTAFDTAISVSGITQDDQFSTADGGAFTTMVGSAAVTQQDQTSTATGVETVAGTSTQTQADQTATATGTALLAVTGTAAVIQADQTSTATAVETATGTSAATQAAQTSTASGTVAPPVTGTAAASQADQTSSGLGSVGQIIFGLASATQTDQTSTASGALTVTGSAAVAQASQTSTGTGLETVTGTSTAGQADQTSTTAGNVLFTASGAGSQDSQTSTASGIILDALPIGVGDATQDDQTSTGTGTQTDMAGTFQWAGGSPLNRNGAGRPLIRNGATLPRRRWETAQPRK